MREGTQEEDWVRAELSHLGASEYFPTSDQPRYHNIKDSLLSFFTIRYHFIT